MNDTKILHYGTVTPPLKETSDTLMAEPDSFTYNRR